jgi:glutamate synthase domain-containing protein 3
MDQPADVEELKELISNHTNLTGSVVGQGILDDWEGSLKSFKKVIPILYREILNRKLEEAVTT